MQRSTGNSIVILCAIFLFGGAIVFSLYVKDNDSLQNKEYLAECSFTQSSNTFKINAICVQQKKLPQLSLTDIINEVWGQIEGFSGYYEPQSQSFNYYGATPIFKTKGSSYLKGDEKSDYLISEAVKKRKKN